MAHYVSSLNSLATCSSFVPGRDSFCLSMALVGIVCLAAAMAIVYRAEGEAVAVPLRLDE